ncbi:hypothetical protein ACFFJ7_05390 [Pseudochelatococcus lubricantis]|uniref:hypothetical protein n=1 Tax=Pseudochelatococcus lubricantis TaxID=1538102 RepID=UPI0035ED1700
MKPSEARAMYRRQIEQHGETVKLRRGFDGAECEVLARVTGYQPEQLTTGITLGHRRVIILAETIPASWLGPPVKNDRIIWAGLTLTVTAVDSATRRLGGDTVAFELTALGA